MWKLYFIYVKKLSGQFEDHHRDFPVQEIIVSDNNPGIEITKEGTSREIDVLHHKNFESL